ncbi:hypothetical protein ACFY8C_38670 [Streptomyces flavochromogenes]|uniref:Abortive infection protein-like C-terminal domain-containing protein n=1 Tax=Streptomyces flavochromogenes TaxID=68199 RepID=A0ABW6Y351_9ACTN
MTTAPRPRFSVRAGRAVPEFDGPFEGVPPHLTGPLQEWVQQALFVGREYDEDTAQILCMRLRISARRRGGGAFPYTWALQGCEGDELLDVIDALLGYWFEIEADGSTEVLEALLSNAGSAYRVTEMEDGLEERVTPAVRDAVRRTIAEAATAPSAGSAADHLAAAWQAAYGRGPDPERAYSESIKAVEAAAHAVIEPNNPKATLGTMLRVIRNSPEKFGAAIPPKNGDSIVPAEAMMRALWDGQTSRHGGQTPTVPETLESARAGVHLAAALVQWFVSGAVARTP